MIDNPIVRALSMLVGFVLLMIAMGGACDKASEEGWNGPSSTPGAGSRPKPKPARR